MRAVPGVRNAAWGSSLPLEGAFLGGFGFDIVGDPPVTASERPLVEYQIVSPLFLSTLEVPVVRGRGITEQDTTASPAVALVSDAFVRRYLQGRDPLGLRIAVRPISIGGSEPVVREIVGVVQQVKQRADETEASAIVYVPRAQNAWNWAVLLVTAADGPAARLAADVRAAIRRVAPNVPLPPARTLAEVERGATERPRFRTTMVVTFAGLALTLAMIGVFGVLGYSVQQRRREFGIRMALGATSGTVLRMVLAHAGRVIGAGALIGLLLAAVLAQSISTFLFGVQPLDPVTFGSVALVLTVTAALATAIPALRASRTDPVVAFRSE